MAGFALRADPASHIGMTKARKVYLPGLKGTD
jgi:hypothetical protein